MFQPISDSWMLADQLRREPLRGQAVLDLCTGSGVLAVTAALHGASEVVAVDVSRRSLLSVWLNSLANGVRVKLRRGDLFGAVGQQRFDVIVSNPPYVPSPRTALPDRGLERAWEAGPDGRVFIDRIFSAAPDHLRPGGALLLVQSVICGESKTLEAASAAGLQAKVVFRHVGELGPRMRAREEWLRREGLALDGRDEVIVVRAQKA